DLSPDIGGAVAIASNKGSADIFGITRQGSLLHWQFLGGVASGLFERVVPIGTPVLEGSPAAIWHQNRLFAVARTADQKLAAFAQNSAEQPWAVAASGVLAADAVKSDPKVASQPEELSVVARLKSGAVLILKFENESWTPEPLDRASADTSDSSMKALAT